MTTLAQDEEFEPYEEMVSYDELSASAGRTRQESKLTDSDDPWSRELARLIEAYDRPAAPGRPKTVRPARHCSVRRARGRSRRVRRPRRAGGNRARAGGDGDGDGPPRDPYDESARRAVLTCLCGLRVLSVRPAGAKILGRFPDAPSGPLARRCGTELPQGSYSDEEAS